MKNISVIGLGKLGLPTAVFYASRGAEVICFDINEGLIEELNRGQVVLNENGLASLFRKCRKRLEFVSDIKHAILKSEITFIGVPTPSLSSGEFSSEYIERVVRQLAPVIKRKEKWHLIVLVSTVLPGVTKMVVVDVIEKLTSKKCGQDFGVCYSPEFVALGSVLENLAHPDFFIIGESDVLSGSTLEKFYTRTVIRHTASQIPVHHTNFVNAELAKVGINTFVTTKISYANMLSSLCGCVEGLDAKEVLRIVGSDRRIGNLYLGVGAPYGGPCFPRDNLALIAYANSVGSSAEIALATHEINQRQVDDIIYLATAHGEKNISVLGLSYKYGTNVIEKSHSTIVVTRLISANMAVSVFDQQEIICEARKVFGNSVRYAKSIMDAVQNADTVIVAHPDRNMVPDLSLLKTGATIVDIWRILDRKHVEKFGLRYKATGLKT